MKRTLFIALAYILSACAVQGAYQAYQVASGVMGTTKAYYAHKMLKQVKNSPPLFRDYQSVRTDIKIAPRDEAKSQNLIAAFSDNFSYLIEQDSHLFETGELQFCTTQCAGKTLTVQFKEKAYDENILQKLALGNKLRGTLYFIDPEKGVLHEDQLEEADSYENLLNDIHVFVSAKMIAQLNATLAGKSQEEAQKDAERVVEKSKAVEVVKPEYRELFKHS